MCIRRCEWARSELEIEYHDKEWGKPLHEDKALFEMLNLQCMQSGLSWKTILNKREAIRTAFDGFDPRRVSSYDEKKLLELMGNSSIIRNKSKINAVIENAKAFLEVQYEFGSFDKYIWSFVEGKTIKNSWTSMEQLPAMTEISREMSIALHSRGFKYIGPTTCYAFMQSVGMVNDHMTWCEQYSKSASLSSFASESVQGWKELIK